MILPSQTPLVSTQMENLETTVNCFKQSSMLQIQGQDMGDSLSGEVHLLVPGGVSCLACIWQRGKRVSLGALS